MPLFNTPTIEMGMSELISTSEVTDDGITIDWDLSELDEVFLTTQPSVGNLLDDVELDSLLQPLSAL